MVKTHPDDDQPIQDVLSWKESSDNWRLGCVGPDNEPNRKFVPKSLLEAEFKRPGRVEELLETHFPNNKEPLPDASYIRDYYLRVFIILIGIGHGRMIAHFLLYQHLRDRHLPFQPKPNNFPTSSSTTPDIWVSFDEEQWAFCAVKLDYNMHSRFNPEEILPVVHKEKLGEGGSAITHKVTVHDDYDNLHPPGYETKVLRNSMP